MFSLIRTNLAMGVAKEMTPAGTKGRAETSNIPITDLGRSLRVSR